MRRRHRLAAVGAWSVRPVLGGLLAAACAAPLLGVDALLVGLAFALLLLLTEVALELVLRRLGARPPHGRAAAVSILAPIPPCHPRRKDAPAGEDEAA